RDYKVTGVQTCALPICGVLELLAAAARIRRRAGDRMLDAGQEIVAYVFRILEAASAGVAVRERAGLDPIFVGRDDLHELGAGVRRAAAHVAPVALVRERIERSGEGEGEVRFRVQVVLPIALGAARLREAEVEPNPAAAPDPVLHPVEHALAA